MEFTDFSKTSLYEPSSQSVWDFGDFAAAAERNSLGFMELLGYQTHHQFQDCYETLQSQTQPLSCSVSTILEAPTSKVEPLSSDQLLINPPATPIYSSISSASSEAVNEEKPKRDEEEEHKKSISSKQLLLKQKKKKKKKQKRECVGRVAFMTKSEVDHLEDGYRWRKYGQKAVKNSPFPRSYYRCTTASCNVKKRVERSFRDPSTVVTTYEGQHTHISPLMSRPISTGSGGFFGSSVPTSNLSNFVYPIESSRALMSPQFQQIVHYQQKHELMSSSFGGVNEYHANGYGDDDHRLKKTRGLVKDNGLLQDVVPSHMLNEDYY